MKSQPYFPVHGNTGIYRRLKGADRRNLLSCLQLPVLHISDVTVRGPDPGPLVHGLQHIHSLSCCCLRDNLALHTTLHSDLACLFQHCRVIGLPGCVDKHPLNLACGKGLRADIRIIYHNSKRQVHSFLCDLKERSLLALGTFIRIHNGFRQCIHKQFFALIPVKALVQMFIYPVHRQVYLAILVDSFLLLHLVIQNKGHLAALNAKYPALIRQLIAGHVFLGKKHSQTTACQDKYEQQNQHRDSAAVTFSSSAHPVLQFPNDCFYSTTKQSVCTNYLLTIYSHYGGNRYKSPVCAALLWLHRLRRYS